MPNPLSPCTRTIGRWGAASCTVIIGELVAIAIRSKPQLLPNCIPGVLIYELAPGLTLALAVVLALTIVTPHDRRRYTMSAGVVFLATAAGAGIAATILDLLGSRLGA